MYPNTVGKFVTRDADLVFHRQPGTQSQESEFFFANKTWDLVPGTRNISSGTLDNHFYESQIERMRPTVDPLSTSLCSAHSISPFP